MWFSTLMLLLAFVGYAILRLVQRWIGMPETSFFEYLQIFFFVMVLQMLYNITEKQYGIDD